MTEKQTRPLKSLPVANYKSALARAVEWMGDRYLLAKPINRTHDSWRKLTAADWSMPVDIKSAER